MKYVGAHVSIRGGVFNAPLNAKRIDAKAFAIFTKNQRQWNAKPLTDEDISKFQENCKECGYTSEYILPHDAYLINLGAPEKDDLTNSRNSFTEEMKRCESLGLKFLVLHPGSHKKKMSDQDCLNQISEGINMAINETKNVIAVIENTAGQGGDLGYRFEHLASIIEKIDDKNRVGVCFDTCHAFASGYDLRTHEGFDDTMKRFDQIVGLKFLKGIHLNDSKYDLGTRKDRHANLGKGFLGWETFKFVMKDSRFDNIPIILETIDEELWPQEIRQLYEL